MTGSTEQFALPVRAGQSLGGLIGRLIFGGCTLVLLLFVAFWSELGEPISRGGAAVLAVVAFSLHLACGRSRVSAFDPVIWIPISMLIFYFGVPISAEVLDDTGIANYDPWRVGFVPQLGLGLTTALLGMTAYIWGVHLVGLRDLSGPPDLSKGGDPTLTLPALLFTIGSVAMVTGGIALVGPSVVFGYYNDWWDAKKAGADARWIDVGLSFMQASVYALLASAHHRRPLLRYLAYAVGALIIVITVQKGARAQLVAFAIGAAWCYSQRVRRVRPAIAVAAAVAALLVMPVLKEWRHSRSVEATSDASVRELAASAFAEMGSSVYTVVYTMHLIPRTRDYASGASYWDALGNLIPNLGLTPGKSWGASDLEDHPSRWITSELNPIWYHAGGGYGSSMVAELYFNFGILGVVLGATLLGALTAKVRNASQGASGLKLVASALFFGAMVIHVRNTIGVPLKNFAWPVIGLFLVQRGILLLGFGRPGSVSAQTTPAFSADLEEPGSAPPRIGA